MILHNVEPEDEYVRARLIRFSCIGWLAWILPICQGKEL
jgi:hypothetical protein